MVKRSKGLRSKSRQILQIKPRSRGFSSITKSLHKFDIGDSVHIVIDPSTHKGMPHIRFHGFTGSIEGKQGSSYVIGIRVGKKKKTLVIRPEHLRRG